MANLERAIEIAVSAHRNQVDKSGSPFILHPLRVMQMGENQLEMICGILHDVVEDSNWTFEMLKKEGFSNEVIETVKYLTKTPNDDNYDAFINRVCENRTAIRVKIHDLLDNMDITRLRLVDSSDSERLEKYLKAYRKLKNYEDSL